VCGKNFFELGGADSVCVLGAVFVCGCVLGFVWRGFGALSMLLKVTLNVVKSDVYHNADFLGMGSKFQKKKGLNPFSLLLPALRNCGHVRGELSLVTLTLKRSLTSLPEIHGSPPGYVTYLV